MASDNFEKEFNLLIVETFHNILKTELRMINEITNSGLSMREVHLLEVVASGPKITISEISRAFEITMASVTVMVNKLVRKGFLKKTKSADDARTVFLALTKAGSKINRQHEKFHEKMVAKVSKDLNRDEKQVLAGGVRALNEMFKREFENI